MIENLPNVIVGGGLLASREVITKLLGPTAEYIGLATRDAVKKCNENFVRILQAMYEKVKDDIDLDQQVNPRVLKAAWEEGRFVEDEISTEYFAGILASARTDDGTDDSALPFTSVLSGMSSTEIRLHFIVYSLIAKGARQDRLFNIKTWNNLELSVDGSEFLAAMGLDSVDGPGMLLLALNALAQHKLIQERFSADLLGVEESNGLQLSRDRVVVRITSFGVSLFLRAFGLRGIHADVISSLDTDYGLSDGVKSAVVLPNQYTCRLRQPSDPLRELRADLEDKLTDLESAIDGVRDELETRNDDDDENSDGK